jgi:hypothetical protein
MTIEISLSALPNLRGCWLWLARVVWVLIALLCISLFIMGTAAQYNRIRAPCSILPLEEQSNCFPTENALKQFGLTWDDLANFYTPIATVAALPFILMGCLVFWRKSETILGLLFSLAIATAGSAAINTEMLNTLWLEYPGLRELEEAKG